jgi:hypothetical protein
MRISKEVNTLERGGVGAETTFRIQANARAFSILSSNLYTDKIKAVIRELSCNALDSHVAAGKQNTPFDVHLPSSLEPWFSVTDYGLGLSHEQVMDLYTTYFSSTKTNSNDYVGALGLGSKSPFAYTSGFDVVSTYNGVQNSYAMFINEQGEPSVARLGTQNVTAPNGVMVKLPVKSEDFTSFRRSAEDVFTWFAHKPVVTGSRDFRFQEVAPTRQGKGWCFFETERYYGSGAVARMGSVAYPIKRDQVNSKFERLLAHNLVVEFGIGELDVAASREELSYDPTTIAVLERRLEAVLGEIQSQVGGEFAKCSTLWEARCLLQKMTHGSYQARELYRMLSAGGVPFTWNGQVVDETELTTSTITADTKVIVAHLRDSGRRESCRYISCHKMVQFFRQDVSDTTSRVVAWHRNEISQGRHPYIYIITGEDSEVVTVMNRLGNPPITLASTLSRNPRASMKFKGRAWSGNRVNRGWGRSRKSDDWADEKELTVGQGGYYVTTLNLDPQTPEETPLSLGSLIGSLRKLDLMDHKVAVWGINKTNSRLIAEDSNWIEFTAWARQQIAAYLSGNQVEHRLKMAAEARHFASEVGHDLTPWRVFETHTNSVGRLVREYQRVMLENAKLVKVYKTSIDPTVVRHACSYAGVSANFKDPDVTHINRMCDDVRREYPLMRYAFGQGSASLADFEAYVNSVDAAAITK